MKGPSRLSGFRRLSARDRVEALREAGWLGAGDCRALNGGEATLDTERANRTIENVVGVFGLPWGIGLNFRINDRDYVVPMVVEEPSIVAGVSAAAKLAHTQVGFEAAARENLLAGQIQVLDVGDPEVARRAVLERQQELIDLANSLHPNMVARGGGAREVEAHVHYRASSGTSMLVVHLLVDSGDAMGANLVNTMCEGVAPLLETVTGGRVCLRILSNLADRALVHARIVLEPERLRDRKLDAERICDGIVAASDLAAVDPYRAATHNKGILNGIDALAIATGNDWRAIEAGAHAYAAADGTYRGLSRWWRDERGHLVGELEMPLKVGTVGANLESNPGVGVNQRILGIESARELAQVMASVGLAQNLAALRALVTHGIQHGHMTLHARSVATSAGASPQQFDSVVERLIESGEVKLWKARQIITELESQPAQAERETAASEARHVTGHGKIILLGEHAVVYGSRVLAAPLPTAVEARAELGHGQTEFYIPRWGIEHVLPHNPEEWHSFEKPVGLILQRLGLAERALRLYLFPRVPRAMGLGSSAAVAVAVIRALDDYFGLGLDNAEVNRLAYESEKVAHGDPSGIDNHIATYGQSVVYQRGEPPIWQEAHPPAPVSMVIGLSGIESLTARTVANVRAARERAPARFDRIFSEIDALTGEGVEAFQAGKLERLGEHMNVCHGLLNAIGVSCREIEELVEIARSNGALGAKLTGGGGGGAMIALCPNNHQRVRAAIEQRGYEAMEIQIA